MKKFTLFFTLLFMLLGTAMATEQLSLIRTFAGAEWSYNAATSGAWYGKVVINSTTPNVTLKATDEEADVIGWSTQGTTRRPWLQAGYVYTITLAEGYNITAYTLTTQSTTANNKSTFQYTTASGLSTSATQTTSNQTVEVTGIDTNSITLDLTGYSQSGTHGIIITDLIITYESTLSGTYLRTDIEGWSDNNPNTHLGTITIGDAAFKLTPDNEVVSNLSASVEEGTTLAFTRKYRGYNFLGFYIGETSLGENPTLTAEQAAEISEETPIVAKFSATEDVTLFYDDDEKSYRIPAIAKTASNRLIAVSDYRHSLDDIGRDKHGTGTHRIDLVIRTSDDNGETWSEKRTIATGSGTFGANDCAYGDAAIATVGDKVLVMAAAGDVMFPNGTADAHNRTVRIYSEDNGVNWQCEDISETLFINSNATIPNGYSAFFGSGKLAVDEDIDGNGTARIYGAMLIKNASAGNNIYVIYSDDFGATWKILGGSTTQVARADEPKVEILPNGQILLSARRVGGRHFRIFTYGDGEDDKVNGVGEWDSSTANGCDNGGSNGTNGEIMCVDAKKGDGTPVTLLLQSQPKGGSGQYDRRNVTIWYKEISAAETYTSQQIAANWTMGLQVSEVLSSYSAMAMQADGEIAFFFEEAPCYDDNYEKGYCMVYTPLTIEKITNLNYYSPDADFSTAVTVDIELTDAEGNIYRDQLTDCTINNITASLNEKYKYITLGSTAVLSGKNDLYSYTNSVALPFKVSNDETTVWHNIYYPMFTNSYYPTYINSGDNIGLYKEDVTYGNSSYNTQSYADDINWAIYNVDNGFSFKLKNKKNGQFITTDMTEATENNAGAVFYFTDNMEDATAFTLVKNSDPKYNGEYGLEHNDGYMCVWSVNDGYITYTTNNTHQGGWLKITEAPDFDTLIGNANSVLSSFGSALGEYSASDATVVEAAKAAMENSNSVTYNNLLAYVALSESATLNMPEAGGFYRLKGISGNYIDASSIYNDATATTGQMSMKTAEACNLAGTIFYYTADKNFLNYATGTYTYQTREIGSVGDTKGVWTIAESPRGGGKYALSCTTTGGVGSHLHDNSGNRADRCSSNCGTRHDFTIEEVTYLPVIIGNVGYSTFFAPVAVEIPTDVTAYRAELNGNTIDLYEFDGVIPAGQAVILKATAGTYEFHITDNVEFDGNNVLLGTTDKTLTSTITSPYTLQTAASEPTGVIMRKYTGDYINGFKMYMSITDSQAAAFSFRFPGTTGIEEVEGAADNKNNIVYDLFGRPVVNPIKGIYITNGKKVIY